MNARTRIRRAALLAAVWLVGVAGCAGPGPETFPAAPFRCETPDNAGWRSVLWDTSGDGSADYRERLSPAGRLAVIDYDLDGDGRFDLSIDVAAAARGAPHIVLISDSIPIRVARRLQAAGYLPMFPPASEVISPFPVMTDLSLDEFFATGPAPGVEARHVRDGKLVGGTNAYVHEANSPWEVHADYFLDHLDHWALYLWPSAWHNRELRDTQRALARSDADPFIAYFAGTSSLGARFGDDGHVIGLTRFDRFCRWLIWKHRGRVNITLMSDHGHNNVLSQRIPLPERLEALGYRVVKKLSRPGDVIVPEFGPVTCATLGTNEPAKVAADVAQIDGIEHAMYLDSDTGEVVVLTRDGEARIAALPQVRDSELVCSAGRPAPDGDPAACAAPLGLRFRYRSDRGDPLKLLDVWSNLSAAGRVDSAGYVADADLLAATAAHVYPDAVARLWRSFHGLIANTPDVMLATEDGRHCGSETLSDFLDMLGAHGNLGRESTIGIAMTTAGELPPVMRMEDLPAELEKLNLPIPRGRPEE